MFVVLDERLQIANAIVACFEREGVAAIAVGAGEFEAWFEGLGESESAAIEGILLGSVIARRAVPSFIQNRCRAPIIGVLDGRALSETLELFSNGVNDVVVKPFHVREILARVAAINRRAAPVPDFVEVDRVRVFLDGQDPLVDGAPLALPRRERRILEYLVLSRNLRVTKTQIFNRVYGLFNEQIHENVIESHISRLRKRLKQRLGYDPVDSQRYLGYRFVSEDGAASGSRPDAWSPSLAQGPNDLIQVNSMMRKEKVDGSLRGDDDECFGDVCAGGSARYGG